MKNNLLHQALSQALVALTHLSNNEIKQLTLLDCALTLNTLPTNDSLAGLRAQLAKRLHRQLTPAWLSEGDLFEVFLILGVLWKYDQQQISGEHLAYAVQRLVQSEVQVGGPYASNGIIDEVANLQIAFFVQMAAKPLPSLNTYFRQIIATGHLEDNTTLNKPYTLYLLNRLYNCPVADHRLKTPAHQATVLTTMKQHTPDSQQALLAICGRQQPTGFWNPEALLSGQPGSRATTTALIVKCLMLHQSNDHLVTVSVELQQHQLVAKITKQLFENHAEPLRQSTLAAIDKICSVERTFEITLLSYFFARALKHPINLTDQQFAILGAANVCGWVACSIYDDFLDDEGIVAQLPVANVTMRASLDCFRVLLPEQSPFARYIAKTFTEMDEANAWEVNNCRFIVRDNTITIGQLPRYGKRTALAARSFAHALGPITILASYTTSTRSQIHHIEVAFRHYLIARQLNDDLHDWTNDMKAGQGSYVVSAILRDMHVQSGTYNLSVLLSNMQKKFRRTTMPQVCLLALRHISEARRNFTKSDLLHSTNAVYTLLNKLEGSLRHSLDTHAKAEALVKTPVTYSS